MNAGALDGPGARPALSPLVMKLSFLLFAFVILVRAAAEPALAWHPRISAVNPAVGDTVEVVLTAELPPHALVYSSDFKSDIGPQPTTLDLVGSEGIEAVGPVRSVDAKRKTDKTWDIELGYFETKAELRQTVRITRADFVVRGKVAGQLCDEKEGTCTLFDQALELKP